MAKLWLPTNTKVKVKEGERETIFIVPSDASFESKQQRDEVIQAAVEREQERLKKLGAKPQRTISEKDAGKLLKEFRQHLQEKKERTAPRKYTEGY